jgi:hypothetical protein
MSSSTNFTTVRKMVHDHLLDAEKSFTGASGDNPGPTPDAAYACAFSTATGAYAVQGVTVKEWSQLHEEVREHQAIHRSK